jgi:ATP-binding cassette subfamily B protein
MGESGRGKTTLVKLLLKFYKIDDGVITIDGINIDGIDSDSIRKNINYIDQKTILFNNTILENIKYGKINISDDNIISIIQKYDLVSILGDLNKKIEKHGSNVSLGMQKVILTLRGILKDSSVYFFDEPLASIDTDTKQKIIKMINDIPRDKTVVIITHDQEIVKIADVVKKI